LGKTYVWEGGEERTVVYGVVLAWVQGGVLVIQWDVVVRYVVDQVLSSPRNLKLSGQGD